MNFTDAERAAALALIDLAFAEDWHDEGDLTCNAVIPPALRGEAVFVNRTPGVLAGMVVAQMIYHHQRAGGSDVAFELLEPDGSVLGPNTPLARVRGSMAVVLSTERVILNFLQRLSGIATVTREYADAVAGLPCRLYDTRKTTPGWRLLEKYAVRCGGGFNHRMGLHDGVMLKDNHLAALARAGGRGTIPEAVRLVRQKYGTRYPVEVEVDTLDQLDDALTAGAEIVLLDNMTTDQLREAVRRRNAAAPGVLLEASGGVNLRTVRPVAETGVDRVSVGALTHSAPALDVGLDYTHD